MSTPAKQPQKKGGWGSLLSGAVANLESRLDAILAEDSEASARQRASEAAIKDAKNRDRAGSGSLNIPPKSSTASSRDASRSRVNDKLAERLAKATAKKEGSQAGSGVPSRVSSPGNGASSPRPSAELRRSQDAPRSVPEVKQPEDENKKEDIVEEQREGVDGPAKGSALLASGLPINPAKISTDSPRPSVELPSTDASNRTSSDIPNGASQSGKSAAELEAEMEQMRQDYVQAEKQRQEEMHTYLEKIDALQAKLTYLAKETVAAAQEANASTSGSLEESLAEKDERIALLMEEGEKLSKTELRHLQTIKKLRAKTAEDEKHVADVKRKLERAERAELDLKQKLRRSEAAERQANEKSKQIVLIEKQVEELRVDRENASELIRALTAQLKEANEKAEKATKEANSKAAEVDRNKIATLENELEDAQIEKKLAEDRAKSEVAKVREELERQKDRFNVTEMELKNEITGLESRFEAMRSRAEEASSETVGSESNVKLLRQIETLQSQYSLAKENWETIEGSLNARVSQVEKERDDASRREAEVRKKARDAATKSRKLEDELEAAQDQITSLTQELRNQKEELQKLRGKLENAESALVDAKADAEKQRKLWDAEVNQRVEEERLRWQRAVQREAPTIRNGSTSRKTSAAEPASLHSSARRPMTRLTSGELSVMSPETQPRPTSSSTSRRGSVLPIHTTPSRQNPISSSFSVDASSSPSLSRNESAFSLDQQQPPSIPPTPSPLEIDTADLDSNAPAPSPSHRTINDLMGTSTANTAAGPSVQLVDRLSTLVRRLESEKASFKDELARLSAQRDEARNEVVRLMRQGEEAKSEKERVQGLEKELEEVKTRYEACLEVLGEREEEVEELRSDVGELKRLYRELVESKVGAGSAS
jgi:TATA element modulatory factor